MNIILLRAPDWISEAEVRLSDHRARHILDQLKSKPEDCLRVGLINGAKGTGRVLHTTPNTVVLHVTLDEPMLPGPGLHLVVALPRPKMLQRILRTAAEFGVEQLSFIHSYRVEKSYWQTPLLAPERIEHFLLRGVERSGDTRLPSVTCYRRFRPFVEDILPALFAPNTGFVAHPDAPAHLSACPTPRLLIVGPEGGFIPFEIALLEEQGIQRASLGPRILSVDTAVTAVLALTATPS
jgi:RsmE family RNA methyltransferase